MASLFQGRSCLTGTDAVCRTVQFEGRSFEEIQEELIRKAAYRAVELLEKVRTEQC